MKESEVERRKKQDDSKVVVVADRDAKDYWWVICRRAMDGKKDLVLQFVDKHAGTAELLIRSLRCFGWLEDDRRKAMIETQGENSYELLVNQVFVSAVGSIRDLGPEEK